MKSATCDSQVHFCDRTKINADSAHSPASRPLTVLVIRNLSSGGTNCGLTLIWPAVQGVTGYNVERGTVPGGPYTLISSNQTATTFTDTNLSNPNYYYAVTARLNNYEGPASNEVGLPPAVGSPWTAGYVGTAVGDGIYESSTNWVLTCSQGDIPGGQFQRTMHVCIFTVERGRNVHRAAGQCKSPGDQSEPILEIRGNVAGKHER